MAAQHDFARFHLLKPWLLETVNRMLARNIAKMTGKISHEQTEQKQDDSVKSGAFEVLEQCHFVFGRGECIDVGSLKPDWIVSKDRFMCH